MKKEHILIVEDEAVLFLELQEILEEENYSVSDYTPSYEKAIASINSNRPDIALLDVNLQGKKSGIDLGKVLNKKYKIPFIYVTELDDNQTFYKGLHTHHEHFIVKTKPHLNPKEIIRAVQTVLARHKKHEDLESIGVIGLLDYLENLKNYCKGCITSVPVKYENIGYFTVKPFVNKDGELESLKSNYLWFKTNDDKQFFLRKSLKDLQQILPYHFARINDRRIVNLLPAFLKGRINGNRIVIMGVEMKITATYKEEFQKRYNAIYNSFTK